MATKAADRRVTRTRALLQTALIELVLEKGYEGVTVQDIIDRANVGRSTFYAHFLDKQHLFVSGFEELHQSLAQQQAVQATPGSQRLSFSLGMFEHASSYRSVYRALVGKQGGAMIHQQMRQLLTQLVQDELLIIAPGETTPVPREMVVDYTVSAFMSILGWLADHETAFTPAQMDDMFQRLTMPGVVAGLGMTAEGE